MRRSRAPSSPTRVYNELLQGSKVVQQNTENADPPDYTRSVCILARFIENDPCTAVCEHDSCRPPRWSNRVQRRVFEENHIIQAQLVSNDPILTVALRTVRDALQRYKTFHDVARFYVDRIPPHPSTSFAYVNEPFRFDDIVFPHRSAWAAFLACKNLWQNATDIPLFDEMAVGKRQSRAKSEPRSDEASMWEIFSTSSTPRSEASSFNIDKVSDWRRGSRRQRSMSRSQDRDARVEAFFADRMGGSIM